MDIINPILRGFNPDPSICRVGEDYYIATSTFEWWPGVQIHHSRDLVHWKLIGHALTRDSQIDLRGNPCSGGVWAPCLTWHDNRFWLIYSNVRNWAAPYKDVHNYLVTAPAIDGPWSEPIFLNSSGFDPSLFHDDDGRKWIVNQKWDHRQGRNKFDGIVLQEYDHEAGKLIGPRSDIFAGSEIKATEGPHLYKKDGWYWLMTAEGGTGHGHAVTLARSKDIEGPYDIHPDNPVVTSRDRDDLELCKAGHGSWVDTPGGEWYLVHLVGRPLKKQDGSRGVCTLGRETAIQKLVWHDDGWPRLAQGGHHPALVVTGPDLPAHPWPEEPVQDDFDSTTPSPHLAGLRRAFDDDWISFSERPGWMRLKGQESLASRHRQACVGRRIQSFDVTVTTCLEFEPEDYQQMAGLAFIYDVETWYYLHIRGTDEGGIGLNLKITDMQKESELLEQDLPLESGRIFLRGRMTNDELRLAWSTDGEDWVRIGDVFDASRLSDEYGNYTRNGNFTGAFTALACQDLSGRRKHADFDFLRYEEHI